MKHGKKLISARQKVDKTKLRSPEEAVALMRQVKFAKFDETVELRIKVICNSYTNVRGFVTLPAGNGKQVKVLGLCKGDKQAEANEAGAYFVGGDELIDKIQN